MTDHNSHASFPPVKLVSGVPTSEDFPIAITTEHHQAWGIPDTFDITGLPLVMSDNQLKSMVLAIWQEFMLHDEVLSAIQFLKNSPYRVRHSPEIEKALSMTVATIDWMNNPLKATSINTPSDPNGVPLQVEVSTPLPGPLTGQVAGRYDYILLRLPPNSNIIDFGCIDGTMTNRWGLAGFKVTGVDMSQNSVEIANRKASEFNTGARHICSFFKNAPNLLPNHSYDVFTCADTYEHVVDPVQDLLAPARKLLHADGKAILVTPHGAWFRGKFLDWGHPWVWYKTGGTWLSPNPRAHLVAPTVWSVSQHFSEAGFWVQESHVILQASPDTPGQGNVCVEAKVSPPPIWPGYSFSFYGDFNIDSCDSHMINCAETLAKMGHTVKVYVKMRDLTQECIHNFVQYLDISKSSGIVCDVIVTMDGKVPPGSKARHSSSTLDSLLLTQIATW